MAKGETEEKIKVSEVKRKQKAERPKPKSRRRPIALVEGKEDAEKFTDKTWSQVVKDKGNPVSIATVMIKTLQAIDIQCSKVLAKSHPHLRPLLICFELLGNGFTWIALGAYTFYTSRDDDVTMRLLFLFFCGFFLDLAMVGSVKLLFKRQRPDLRSDGSYTFSADHYSFPSGHASRAFFCCFFFLHFLRLHFALRFLIMSTAIAIAVSRIMLSRHYVTDVIAGVLLGRLNYFIITWYVIWW